MQRSLEVSLRLKHYVLVSSNLSPFCMCSPRMSYWFDYYLQLCSILSLLSWHFWRCGLEILELEDAKRYNASVGAVTGQQDSCWEVVIEKKDFRVWKRPIPDSHLYEYRGQPTHAHWVSVMQIRHTFRFRSPMFWGFPDRVSFPYLCFNCSVRLLQRCHTETVLQCTGTDFPALFVCCQEYVRLNQCRNELTNPLRHWLTIGKHQE